MKGAPGLAARLGDRPQPGDVDVGVSGGGDVDRRRRATRSDALTGDTQRFGNAGVEPGTQWFPGVEHEEGVVDGGQQAAADGIVVAELGDDTDSHTGQGVQVPGRLVDADQRARAHDQRGGLFDRGARPGNGAPSPPVQGELVALPVAPPCRQDDLVVVAVAAGPRFTVDVEETLGMAEVAGDSDGEVEGDRTVRTPLRWHGEPAAEDEVEARLAPRRAPRDLDEAFVDRLVEGRLDVGAVEGTEAERIDHNSARHTPSVRST